MGDLSLQPEKKAIDPDKNKSLVAIIDDDFSFCIMLKEYLSSNAGLEAEHYLSGDDFLKNYKAKDDRKIILDYDFGNGRDGLFILQKIKAINPTAKVIMVSSQDDLENALETIRNGASDYFLKSNKTVFANIHCSLLRMIEMEKNMWN